MAEKEVREPASFLNDALRKRVGTKELSTYTETEPKHNESTEETDAQHVVEHSW